MIANIFIGIVALIHVYIFIFESFLWEQRGPKVFTSFPKDLFSRTKTMAANQGIYNAFLALGLMWSLCIKDTVWASNVALFFLICVAIAGIIGALTAEKKIFFVQTMPAVIGIVFLLFSK